jgi:hypothetical protein
LQKAVHTGRRRFTVLLTHRRFGKTVGAICDLLRRALLRADGGAYRAAYMAPYLKQAKDVAWDYLKRYARPIPGVKFNETELRCDLPGGARIRLYGADNAASLRGQYLDDVVLDECADIARSIWLLNIRPMLADRLGWALFTGTPRGVNNLLYDRYQEALERAAAPDWALFVHKASETGYVAAEELVRAREAMGQDEYNQEFECSFAAASRGSYYGREIDALEAAGRVRAVPYEPALPVHTAWDLGMDDATAIWFFQVHEGDSWRVVDYYENSGEGLAHYVQVLKDKCPWYGRHIAPHDIMVRELGTGKSRFETARGMGLRFAPVRRLPVIDGINAARRQLPRCFFDAKRCAEGLKALRQYRRNWHERGDVYGGPVHDWTSHAADAFRYAVIGMMPEFFEKTQDKTINWRP